jgi:hypothetical protein
MVRTARRYTGELRHAWILCPRAADESKDIQVRYQTPVSGALEIQVLPALLPRFLYG